MADYKPRNRNQRAGDAPHSWSQRFYDARPPREQPAPCGFRVRDGDGGTQV